MKQYYVSKSGTQQGPIPLSRLKQIVASGELSGSDLCWAEGMTSWQPIHTIVRSQKNKQRVIGCSVISIVVSIIVILVMGAVLRQWTLDTTRTRARNEIIGKTTRYEGNGLAFSYNNNWKITGDELRGKVRWISIESDNNAVFIIAIVPSELSIDLNNFAANIEKERPSSIALGRVSETKTSEISRSIKGEISNGIRHKFSVTLLGENVPHTQDFFLIKTEEANVITMIQAPDEDWKNSDEGFQVIFDSLRFGK